MSNSTSKETQSTNETNDQITNNTKFETKNDTKSYTKISINNQTKNNTKFETKKDSKYDSTEEMNRWRSEKGYKRKYQFREKRNYQVAEISILYMLLNEHFEIEISKTLFRKSTAAKRLFRLKSLTRKNEIIYVEDIIKRRCKEKLTVDINNGTNENTARRRLESYKINEMIHLMIDILEFYGYYFQSHYSTGIDGQYQNETIKRIWLRDKILYGQIEIENVGMKIHSYMMKQVELNRYDFEKGEILKQKK